MSSCKAWDTTRARTRVFFSTPAVLPPKKRVLSPSIIHTWSPPRPNAISKAARARLDTSFTEPTFSLIPIEIVAGTWRGEGNLRIFSRILKPFSSIARRAPREMAKVYISSWKLRTKPSWPSISSTMILLISDQTLVYSRSLRPFVNSSRLSIWIMPHTGWSSSALIRAFSTSVMFLKYSAITACSASSSSLWISGRVSRGSINL